MVWVNTQKAHAIPVVPDTEKAHVIPVMSDTQKAHAIPVMPETDDLVDFSPFVMRGFVSMEDGDSNVPVTILRDTAASQSFILEDVLPFSAESSVGSSVPV